MSLDNSKDWKLNNILRYNRYRVCHMDIIVCPWANGSNTGSLEIMHSCGSYWAR